MTVRLCVDGAKTSSLIVLRGIDTVARWPASDSVPPTYAAGMLDLRRAPATELWLTTGGNSMQFDPVFGPLSVSSERRQGGERTIHGTIGVTAMMPLGGAPGEKAGENHYRLGGQFAARHDPSPEVAPRITPQTQQRVLEAALTSFAMTHSQVNRFPVAGQGDDYRDSVLTQASARRFLERRWGHAVTVERLRVTATGYSVEIRGRYVPIACRVESEDGRVRCD